MQNKPDEIELLRLVASAAAWALASNADDAVGRDGLRRVGINWVMANGELNRALTKLREHYGIENHHINERAKADEFSTHMSGS